MATTLQTSITTKRTRIGPVRAGVLARWHGLRRRLSTWSVAVGFILTVVLASPEMAIATVCTVAIAIDSHIALRMGRTSFVITMLFDITVTSIAIGVLDAPAPAFATTTAYFLVLVAVLGRSRSAWPLGAYAIAAAVAVPMLRTWFGVRDVDASVVVAGGVAVVAVFSYAISFVLTRFAALVRERIGDEERKVTLSDAVSTASRALVAQDDPKALAIAVEAIRNAIGASAAFIEKNVEADDGGLTAVVAEVASSSAFPPPCMAPGTATPWNQMPGAKLHLGGGAPFFFRIEEASGSEFARDDVGGIRSEVNVPVLINGTWVGVVGAADSDPDRKWNTDDLVLLRTLADLTSAFWQRIEDLRVRDTLIGSLDGRLRYEEAIAKSSKFLLGGAGVGVEDALEAIGVAARVDEVFITRTAPVEGDVPDAEAIASWVQPGIEPERVEGTIRSYRDMPSVLDAVHKGAIARVSVDGVSELVVAIEASGGWFGTVGFLRHGAAAPWSKRDAAFLRTIADILGAYYERAETRHHLESLIQSKDILIASVSHELRTPLTAVVGLAEELGSDDYPIGVEEKDQLISVIAHESREMADLVEDLLIAARSEEGLVPVFPERTDLALLAQSVAARLSIPDAVALDLTDEASPAYADPVRVRQILRNLLTNAIRYGGTNISVSVGVRNGRSHIDVTDDGNGIPDEDRTRIFEPYGRSGASHLVSGSVGLGLTLSKRLAELMGGSLEYVPGESCTFRLSLPTGPDTGSS